MKRAFTVIELVIVLAVIAILSAVLLPSLSSSYEDSKAKIIDIYNGSQVECYQGGELVYQGDKNNIPDLGTLTDIEYDNQVIKMYYEP